jgi:hypothetical protein
MVDTSLSTGEVVINPNDGYDIGVLSSTISVKIHGTVSDAEGNVRRGFLFNGEIRQENECGLGTALIHNKFASQLGNPKSVRLFLEGSNLVIANMT